MPALGAVRARTDSLAASAWCAKGAAAAPAMVGRACCTRTAAQLASSAGVEAELQAVLTAASVSPARERAHPSPSLELRPLLRWVVRSRATMAGSAARLQYMWAMIPTRYSLL